MAEGGARRRVRWSLLAAGAALTLLGYLLAYGWCRQQHWLVHRCVVFNDGTRGEHRVATGDPGVPLGMGRVKILLCLEAPPVVFAPLCLLEACWWEAHGR